METKINSVEEARVTFRTFSDGILIEVEESVQVLEAVLKEGWEFSPSQEGRLRDLKAALQLVLDYYDTPVILCDRCGFQSRLRG